MTIAGCPDAETQDKLSKQLIPAAIICPFIVVVLSMLGLMDWVQFYSDTLPTETKQFAVLQYWQFLR